MKTKIKALIFVLLILNPWPCLAEPRTEWPDAELRDNKASLSSIPDDAWILFYDGPIIIMENGAVTINDSDLDSVTVNSGFEIEIDDSTIEFWSDGN